MLEQLHLFFWDVTFEHGCDGALAVAVNIIGWDDIVREVDYIRVFLTAYQMDSLARWLHRYGA